MIEISAISAFYGKHCALDGVSLTVQRGELVVILGANGAGKTTLLKAIGGLVPVAPGGRIAMAGKELTAVPAHDIVAAGVALVPEGRGIFGEMTVRENLLLGAYPARAQDGSAQPRTGAVAVSAPERKAAPDRAHHERRRTADGGHRPGADDGAGYSPA